MTVIDIDETTEAGKARTYRIPRDENGLPVGTLYEDVWERMYNNLSKHYGVDLRTL
jgi:hypothetical protein